MPRISEAWITHLMRLTTKTASRLLFIFIPTPGWKIADETNLTPFLQQIPMDLHTYEILLYIISTNTDIQKQLSNKFLITSICSM
jgi:hypothetical protein